MGKYVIQDIVPAGRKHRTVKKTDTDEVHSAHHHKIVHHGGVPASDEHAHHARKHAEPAPEVQVDHSGVDKVEEQSKHEEVRDEPEVNDIMITQSGASIPPLSEQVMPFYVKKSVNVVAKGAEYSSLGTVPPPIITGPQFESDDDSQRTSWLPWVLGALVVLLVLGFVLNFFSGATVLLISKSDSMPINQEFTALKNPILDELPFAVMKVEESASAEVPATGTKTVTTKASGKIVIYNEQSVAQRLIKNTRFESPTGKIYRINESITIPKKTGTKIGSLEVTVYADEAGAAYNTEPVDFTVPGLKNTSQATKVYARGKGSIVGGASGTIKTVEDVDLKQAQNDLRVALETKLRSKARGNLSPSQIAFDQGLAVDIKDPVLTNDKATSEERAVVTGSGAIYVVVFDRKQLIGAIAKASVPTYAGEEIRLTNLDSLTFTMPTITGEALWNVDTLEFTLSGTPQLRWVINEEIIKNELLGLSKADFNAKMIKYATVERAKASLRPFWKQRFPSDPSKISIKIVDEIKN
jgi:hypothetical protein